MKVSAVGNIAGVGISRVQWVLGPVGLAGLVVHPKILKKWE